MFSDIPAPEATDAAQRFARSTTGMGAPVRRAFLTGTEAADAPQLSKLISGRSQGPGGGGGRGGHTRIALLLTALWVARRPPYEAAHRSSWWAEMIGRPDPQGSGARAVSTAFRSLEERGLISLTKGDATNRKVVRLLQETGTRRPYTPPGADEDSYFRVPEQLWTTGAIGRMDTPTLAMYLILLSHHRPRTPETRVLPQSQGTWFTQKAFSDWYKLSHVTRQRGLSGLEDMGIVSVRQRVVDAQGAVAKRRFYRIEPPFTPPAPQQRPDTPDG